MTDGLNVFHKWMKFHQNVFNSYLAFEQAEFCDRQTDPGTGKNKLPQDPEGGDIISAVPEGGRHNICRVCR